MRFDREALIASIEAGIAAGLIDPRREITVTLMVDHRFAIGTDSVRLAGRR
jgi:hypothetical protein